ncbi:MAG: four helix bundle protein [Candidatus Falkowbacteria bacterium]|nr:four helix bundle protein [Candidatus Falkowbacteria bacterium]
MEGKSLKLGNLKIYNESFSLSNHVWKIINQHNYLIKQTIGPQFIRSVDSISANIAEGFGRSTKKEKIRFYIYARGSVYESLDWLEKCYRRDIINKSDYVKMYLSLMSLPIRLNAIIRTTKQLKY